MARFPRYVPDFRVKLNGNPLEPTMQASVASITYQDGIEGADRVEVTLANRDLRWLDHPLLVPDTGFRLFIGYAPDPLEEVFVGEITGVEPSFPNGGMPTLKIVAHDFLQRLTHGKVDRAFYIKTPVSYFPIPDAVVASIVSAENLLIPYPDPIGGALSVLMAVGAYISGRDAAQQAIPTQRKQSDFDFLSALAKANGWQMYIDHTLNPKGYILRFQFLIQDYSASLSLKWGQSLSEFSPKLTTVGDIAGVSARVWVSSIKMEFIITVGWDFDRGAITLQVQPAIGSLAGLSKTAAKTISIAGAGFLEAPKRILSELLPRLNNRVTGTGSAPGDPRIKGGKVINLDGLGDEFSGLWRITTATHTLDGSGYRTQFDVRKEVWFGGLARPRGASSLVRVQGQKVG